METKLRWLGVTVVLAVAACAHSGSRTSTATGPAAEVVWPAPPAAPRVRLAGVLPDPAAAARRPWWRAALEWLVGAEEQDPRALLLPRPFGVTIAPDGSVLVADPDAARLLRFSPTHVPSDVVCRGKTWSAPMAVALAPDGSVYVADAGEGVVVRWMPDRKCTKLGQGALERPTGVAVQGARIWVADPPRHQVVALSRDGAVLARIGSRGDGDDRFNFPSAVAGFPGGLLVVDALNFRVVRLDPEGRWLGSFGKAGEALGSFLLPKAVAADEAGRVYVSDAQRDSVLVFAPDGSFEYAIGDTGTEPGRFTHPAGLAVAGGKIAIADSHNHRVQLFEFLGDRS